MPHILGHLGPNTFQGFNPGWWGEVLRESQPMQYYSASRPGGEAEAFVSRSPRRQRYFGDSYQDILQDYYGAAGTAMRAGNAPGSFMDFLQTDPWTARYSSLPQSARGVTGMASNPRTRFLFNY